MSLLNTWILSTPSLTYALNASVASLLICGMGLIAARCYRQSTLPSRHGILLCTTLVTLFSPLWVGWAAVANISVWRVTLGDSADAPPRHREANHLNSGSSGELKSRAPAPRNTSFQRMHAGAPPALQKRLDIAEAAPSQATATSFPVAASQPIAVTRAVGTLLCAIWIAGSVASIGRLLRGLVAVERLTRSLSSVTNPRVQQLAAWAAQRLGAQSLPALDESPLVPTPLSLGLLRARIVLPRGLDAELDDDQLRAVLLHEMAHLVRRDHWIGLAQRLTAACFWWNPLLHCVSSGLSELREQICDDIATDSLPTSVRYANALVEMLQRVVDDWCLHTAIGILQSESQQLERRLARLLDPNRSKVIRLTRNQMMALVGFSCIALILVAGANVQVKAAREEPKPKNQQGGAATAVVDPMPPTVETKPLRWPDRLRGNVTNEQGHPIAGARVELELATQGNYSTGYSETLLGRAESITGADGRYKFDATKFPATTHRPFVYTVRATASGYAAWKTWSWFAPGSDNVSAELPKLELPRGRTVRGRCVDAAGTPVAEAVVRTQFMMLNGKGAWGLESFKANENGSFDLIVPKDMNPELWIIAERFAPKRVEALGEAADLGDINLEPGTSVTGVLETRDAKPVADCVVVLESVDDGDLNSVHFPVTLATKTAANGRFRLPPARGDYKLYVTQASRTDEILPDRFLVSTNPPPLVEPQLVSIDGSVAEKAVAVRAVAPAIVSGTIRWPDGRPAIGCDVAAWFMQFRTGIKLASGTTDREGHYSFELPQTKHHVDISAIGLNDDKRVFYTARPAENALTAQKSIQHMTFRGLEKNVAGADWVLEPFDTPERRALQVEPVKTPPEPGESELRRLGAR